MKNNTVSELGYTVHPFMMRLGLSARELMAYALIYCFTLGSEGFYYGRRKTMASALSSSPRTLGRTVDSLISKGLIEVYERHGVKGLRATNVEKEENPPSEEKPKRKYTRRKEDINKNEPRTLDESSDKKKNAPTDVGADEEHDGSFTAYTESQRVCRRNNAKPKFNTVCYGKDCAVVMTEEQYSKLCSLVPASILAGYIASFEDMLNANSVTHHRPPRNHYKTIRKWIEEDMSV